MTRIGMLKAMLAKQGKKEGKIRGKNSLHNNFLHFPFQRFSFTCECDMCMKISNTSNMLCGCLFCRHALKVPANFKYANSTSFL